MELAGHKLGEGTTCTKPRRRDSSYVWETTKGSRVVGDDPESYGKDFGP